MKCSMRKDYWNFGYLFTWVMGPIWRCTCVSAWIPSIVPQSFPTRVVEKNEFLYAPCSLSRMLESGTNRHCVIYGRVMLVHTVCMLPDFLFIPPRSCKDRNCSACHTSGLGLACHISSNCSSVLTVASQDEAYHRYRLHPHPPLCCFWVLYVGIFVKFWLELGGRWTDHRK
jgi:hypothetical protein